MRDWPFVGRNHVHPSGEGFPDMGDRRLASGGLQGCKFHHHFGAGTVEEFIDRDWRRAKFRVDRKTPEVKGCTAAAGLDSDNSKGVSGAFLLEQPGKRAPNVS